MPRSTQFLTRTIVAAVAIFLAVACEDAFVPTAPTEDAAPLPHIINCRAAVAAGTVTCQGLHSDPVPGLSLAVIVGGPYVQLASTNVSYDGSDVFQADVTVENLIAQPMGTPDGTTVTGIKVFFHSGPTVTSGSGTVDVTDYDGTGTFTASEPQPYFEYNEILQTNDISTAKTWRWSVPSTVETFEFSVYVSTDIPTLLYLRYVSPDNFLSTQPATSGTMITLYNYGSGQSTEFQAVLGNAVTGTAYGFSLWFGAGTSSGQTGTWAADILVEHGGVRTTLATHTFSVPFNSVFVEYTANVTGIPGGVVGDKIILRLTLNDVSRGAILFGAPPTDSHVLVPGIVTVSPVPSPPAVWAVDESGVKVEVTAGQSVRYPGR